MIVKSFDSGKLFGAVLGKNAENISIRDVQVIALPGWRRTWKDFIPAFSNAHFNTLAFDLPGFGLTPERENIITTDDYAQLLARVLEKNIDKEIVVIGHSFGGRVAVRLSSHLGSAVAGLILCATPLYRPGRSVRAPFLYQITKMLNKFNLINDKFLEAMRQKYGSSDFKSASPIMRRTMIEALKEERTSAYLDCLNKFQGDLVILWGESDLDTPPSMLEAINDSLRIEREIRLLKGIGHMIPLEAPEVVLSYAHKLIKK